jgi:glucose/arabinose dehydrogenase
MKITTLLFTFYCFSFSYAQTIGLRSFATGFTSPLEIVNTGDSRLFVVEQGGAIKILNADGTVNPTPFLNISTLITSGGERGLLGLAFHPNYATNGFFYINYTNLAGNTVIARYTVDSANPNIANASSASILLTVAQPYANHNGGSLKFGPDGYLYIGMGDGGSAGDPQNRAQNINELLGKMLRIDVNSGAPYGIPADNPYVGTAGADEIWAIGLRNPWKFSFDKTRGNLWIADVGQDATEEIDISPINQAGINYGWHCYEGDSDYDLLGCPAKASTKSPLTTIRHTTGACSITGGYVYNGTIYPNFKGLYFFTDYCLPKIGMMTSSGTLAYSQEFAENNFSTFGEDSNGELYVAALNNGTIFKIIDSSLGIATLEKTPFVIYPNPANSEIIIQKSNKNYPIEVTLFDLEGKMLMKTKTENKDVNIVKIDNFSKGFYLVTVKNEEGHLSTYRLIIE